MNRLLVEETGSLETRLYFVNVSGLRVSDFGFCERKYAPVPPAAIVMIAIPTQRFFAEGGGVALEEGVDVEA